MTDRELIAEARSYLANNDGSSFCYGKDVITRLADALESARADGLRHAAELLESWDSEATVFVLLPGDTAYSGVPVEGVLADRLRALADEAGGAG